MSKNDRNMARSPSFDIRIWAAKAKGLWVIATEAITTSPFDWLTYRLLILPSRCRTGVNRGKAGFPPQQPPTLPLARVLTAAERGSPVCANRPRVRPN